MSPVRYYQDSVYVKGTGYDQDVVPFKLVKGKWSGKGYKVKKDVWVIDARDVYPFSQEDPKESGFSGLFFKPTKAAALKEAMRISPSRMQMEEWVDAGMIPESDLPLKDNAMKKKAKKNPRDENFTPYFYVENMRNHKGRWFNLKPGISKKIELLASGDDWIVADFNDVPGSKFLGEHPSLEDLETIAELLEDHQAHIIDAAMGMGGGVDEAKKYLEEGYGEYGSEGEYAESMVDEGIIDTKTLLRYIDYDALGRDLAIEGNVHETKNGIVVFNRS